MAIWKHTVTITNWKKYKVYSANDFEDENLFNTMKQEITSELTAFKDDGGEYIVTKLKKSKDLKTWNKWWNILYDYCDNKRIWLDIF